ncbi:PREDICTED: Bardet-Biedl syndrome 7 protein homolog [Amphimedon queenslandica]|uniref:Bardet-Biedl syndrome 7 protein homolog n=1 Tax=Amphimedon queenslandica TaxID=400682 RepID=A0A1X7VLG7_AMPQE|nr:PREDICTED: Bardet-Biedl syndrome 7 protein homolog [Amphimedon queenslandica]|eukprot:XP_019862996.1 PREDICTED: Bardet-Biedl syndrome 7 protein homolog [Amphimedon queenslandica]
MDIELAPIFYNQVGALSSNCMKVLPSTKKNPQKIVVGDQDGVLTTFGMKKGDPQIVFKTLPGPPIATLQLNGAPGSVADRIFVSAGAEVKAFTKKGKQFLSFDSNLTEPIRSMYVNGSHLYTVGSYVFNHYVDCIDTDYYLSADTINSVICLPETSHASSSAARGLVPVLACEDCALRVLKGSELLYELEVAGPPTTVALSEEGGAGRGLLYGTSDGRLGLVKILLDAPEYCWDMLNEKKYGSIASIGVHDVTATGVPDILLGRSDGVMEIYSLDENNQPRIQFTHTFSESIASVCGGFVTTPSTPEVLVSTYSGKIHSLSSDNQSKGHGQIPPDVAAKLETLKNEVKSLEDKVSSAYVKYQSIMKGGGEGGPSGGVSALPLLPVNDQFTLNKDEAWYTLSIETQVPLDMLLLQCNVPVDIQEIEKSTAVISYSPPDPKNGSYLLATLRCSMYTSRLEVKVRSIEGQYGTLNVYVTPKLEPCSARLLSYPIKPLSLHQRTHSFDSSLPCNTLEVLGPFSTSDIHSWISFCLPGVSNCPPDGETVTLQFKSSFTQTQLQCTYRQKEAVFKSDNISTISVLKEVLSKEATKKNITIKITHSITDDSAAHMIKLIHPRLEEQLMLAKNVQLIEALQELKVHEKDVSFLSPQCQYILENASLMQEEIKRQPAMIDRYYALITDLFMDRAAFKGVNVQQKVPQLLSLLDECNIDNILQFFEENK